MHRTNSLLVAIKNKYDSDVVRTILEVSPSLVNIPDHEGWFPLHLAVLNRDVVVIDLLLEAGADIESCTPSKLTCLHFAAFHGDRATIEYLISKNASLNVQNERGWTPLHILATKGNTEGMKFLLQNGADSTLKNNKGQLPIDLLPNRPTMIY